MEIKCSQCGNFLTKQICSYKYTESGLDNVSLENTEIYNCSCGVSFPSIYRLPLLNDLIAEQLLQKPSLLTGKETRFLRKRLFLSLKLFSETLGIGNTTLSKWENGRQTQSEPNDRHIRETYIIRKGLRHRKAIQILEYLSNIKLEKPIAEYIIVAERTRDTYNVTLKQIPGGQTSEAFPICYAYEIFLHTGTKPSWTFPNSLGLNVVSPSLITLLVLENKTETTFAMGPM